MMTLLASRSSSAVSSALIGGDLAGGCARRPQPRRAASVPKPPAMTEMNERFIAWHMM